MVTIQVKTHSCDMGKPARWAMGTSDVGAAVNRWEWYTLVKLEVSSGEEPLLRHP
jgi:hypothetical protein